jgi:4a-hydroxytetrahydrobiopterin dehydratase
MDPPLVERHCVPCESGTPPMPEAEEAELLAHLPGWRVEEAGGHRQLVREFRTTDFVSAVDFVNQITPIAEAEGHHPDLLVAWGRVRVQLWTHAAGGLTENDFVLAARIDQAAAAR